MQLNDRIRATIESCGNRFASVEFVKKDGTLRRVTIQQAAMAPRIKGTDRGRKAAAARRRNHPHLLIVWDVHKRAFRSVNLDTVLTVTVAGNVYRFRRLPWQGLKLAA